MIGGLIVASVTLSLAAAPLPSASGIPLTTDWRTFRIAPGDTHHFQLSVENGEPVRLEARQSGIDVQLYATQPDGSTQHVDRPHSVLGLEAMTIVARSSGTLRVEIRVYRSSAPAGEYAIRRVVSAESAAQSAVRIEAERLVTAAELLRANNTAAEARQARETFSRAVALFRQVGDRYEEAVAWYGHGLSERFLGNHHIAAESFRRAEQLFDAIDDDHGRAMSATGLGYCALYAGSYGEATEAFARAQNLRDVQADPGGAALTQSGLAWSHLLDGRAVEALQVFQEALRARRLARDQRGVALTLVGVARAQLALGDINASIVRVDEALTILSKLQDFYGQSSARSLRAYIMLARGHPSDALKEFTTALAMARQVGDEGAQAEALRGQATALERLGQLRAARRSIVAAIGIVESLRSRGENRDWRSTYLASVQSYYELAVGILMRLEASRRGAGFAEAAFDLAERARARALLDSMQAAASGLPDVPSSRLRLAQEALTVAAERYRRIVSRAHSADDRQHAQREVRRARAELYAEEARSGGRFVRSTPVTLAQVRTMLGPRTALVVFFIGDETAYAWTVRRRTLDVRAVPVRRELAVRIRSLRRQLENGPREAGILGLRAMRQVLFPGASWPSNARTLVVVAPEPLHDVPFGAFGIPVNGEAGHSSSPAEVVEIPSLSTGVALLQGRAHPGRPRSAFIVADPVFGASDLRLALEERDPGTERAVSTVLPRLLNTQWEAEAVARYLREDRVRLLRGFDARRDVVLATDLAAYDILHFATHVTVDGTHPELSAIELSSVDEDGAPVVGALRAHELWRQVLRAQLVVLSGCDSARGTVVKGEGVNGFGRLFLLNGASRVMLSLWQVDDRATARFMEAFYRHWLGSSSPRTVARALALARLEMSRHPEFGHPRHWAGFSLQGSWR